MRLRTYIASRDFDIIKNWITGEREHALWCANRFAFPINRENFDAVLSEHADKFADCAFTAVKDSGEAVGFFCFSVNTETNEGMLKFVVIDPGIRGKGIGKEMLRLALKYAFDIANADAVQLMVFSENSAARKCYESVGFTERSVTDGAFGFGDESWGRCNMVIKKNEQSV